MTGKVPARKRAGPALAVVAQVAQACGSCAALGSAQLLQALVVMTFLRLGRALV
jgi:hypothetical protein